MYELESYNAVAKINKSIKIPKAKDLEAVPGIVAWMLTRGGYGEGEDARQLLLHYDDDEAELEGRGTQDQGPVRG